MVLAWTECINSACATVLRSLAQFHLCRSLVQNPVFSCNPKKFRHCAYVVLSSIMSPSTGSLRAPPVNTCLFSLVQGLSMFRLCAYAVPSRTMTSASLGFAGTASGYLLGQFCPNDGVNCAATNPVSWLCLPWTHPVAHHHTAHLYVPIWYSDIPGQLPQDSC